MKLNKKAEYTFFTRPHPRFDDEFVLNEVWDSDCYRVRSEMFKDGIILDIGANIGDFTVYASQFRPVKAYEPQSGNYAMLAMNVDANKGVFKHPVEIFKLGVGKKGTFTIDNSSGHSRIGQEGEECQCITMDEVMKDIEVVDLLKCDIEGGEYDLFDNCSDENLKKIRHLTMELHSWCWDDDRHEKLLNRLEKFFDYKRDGYIQSNLHGKSKWIA